MENINENELLSKENLKYLLQRWGVNELPVTVNDALENWIGNYTIKEILEATNICFSRLKKINVKYIDGVLQNKYKRNTVNNINGDAIPVNVDIRKRFIKYCKENNINPVEKLEEFMDQYSKGAEILYTNKI